MDNEYASFLVSRLCDSDIPDFSLDVEFDLENQRDIILDAQRTRSDVFTQEEKQILEKMLTFYCKTESVKYKQGMNEILAPFLILNRKNIPLSICYTCFRNFIKILLPTLFIDDVFFM